MISRHLPPSLGFSCRIKEGNLPLRSPTLHMFCFLLFKRAEEEPLPGSLSVAVAGSRGTDPDPRAGRPKEPQTLRWPERASALEAGLWPSCGFYFLPKQPGSRMAEGCSGPTANPGVRGKRKMTQPGA